MSTTALRRDYATSLLADLQQSSAAAMPRREAIGDWLRDFLKPARTVNPATEEGDVSNLLAINAHLAAYAVAGGSRPALN